MRAEGVSKLLSPFSVLLVASVVAEESFCASSGTCEGNDANDPSTLMQLQLATAAKATLAGDFGNTKNDTANVRQVGDKDLTWWQDLLIHCFREYPVLSRFLVSLSALSIVLAVAHAFKCFEKADQIGEEIEERGDEPLAENTYMMALGSLVRDSHQLSHGTGSVSLRSTRILITLGIVFLTIFIQVASLICIKVYVSPQSVNNIRDVYDKYEFIMYGNNSNHTTLTVNGKHRGIHRYFQPERFQTLTDDMKSQVCNIPFSQLFFFQVVLFIWSLTCMAQFKEAMESCHLLIVLTPTVGSMSQALATDPHSAGQIVVGLTSGVKAFLTLFVYLPWMFTTSFILWLGSRWLAATNDFGEMVLNAVALEFLLKLKELLYMAMISERNKRDLRNLHCCPPWKEEKAGYSVFLNGIIWGYVAILWMWFYIYYLQSVLPDYQWDVRAVCASWLASL